MIATLPLVSDLALALLLAFSVPGGERVPAETWQRFADVREAGFDPARLEAAKARWGALPSAAFLVVADGAVVAAWGDVERRFMCHSVRKSFLAALYGIYWDKGELELDKTLADLGLDDEPDPLLETEKRARILDLLRARSGVFHPAAYAGRTDSRPRGSEGPGRYFAYNNWDFNTLATILELETGARVFEAFDEHFARPLGMQDWRVSDGYFHHELDKSRYPAYPFRLSARDAARFGLLFAREGLWGDRRILSEHWVRHCTTMYSIDTPQMGYGLMWWVFRDPRLEAHGMVAALGVGNQMIAALPKSDLVIVNRADTYVGEGTPTDGLTELVLAVLEARVGEPVAQPRLVALEEGPGDPLATRAPDERLAELAGDWDAPTPVLGATPRAKVTLRVEDGHLVSHLPFAGTFALYLQADGTLHSEDSHDTFLPLRDPSGAVVGFAEPDQLLEPVLRAASAGNAARVDELLGLVETLESPLVEVARALSELLLGDADGAEARLASAAERDPSVESRVNATGYRCLEGDALDAALAIFELNTRVFPDSANTWDSLAEACLRLGLPDDALGFFERSLELDPANESARAQVERLSGQ